MGNGGPVRGPGRRLGTAAVYGIATLSPATRGLLLVRICASRLGVKPIVASPAPRGGYHGQLEQAHHNVWPPDSVGKTEQPRRGEQGDGLDDVDAKVHP